MKKGTKQSFRKRQSEKKTGLPPGKIIYIGEERKSKITINIIDYNESHFEERTVTNVEECFQYKNTLTNTWINVNGIHQTDIVQKFGEYYGISSLVLEDVVNTTSRPKIDDFKDYVFIILKMLTYDTRIHALKSEQVSLVFGKNFLISFQEDPGDIFDRIRQRLRDADSRTRQLGLDYLSYCLMDRIVDEYFEIIESMGDELESMEEEVSDTASKEFLHRYHQLKQSSIYLRKSVWPLREVINYLLRDEVALIKPVVLPYFRDLYDHTIQVIDTVETYRDLFSDILDLYLSTLSLRMNEVMKVLTVISTIFIPLTFIVGVYGMNFDYMPELRWHGSYFVLWGIMIAVAVGMIIFFKKKKWF